METISSDVKEFVFPPKLNITSIDQNNYIIKEIDGEVYYSNITTQGNSIYRPLDDSSVVTMKNIITGSRGDTLNLCIVTSIVFLNIDIINNIGAFLYDFRYILHDLSSGYVVGDVSSYVNRNLVVDFTLAFKSDNDCETLATNYNKYILNNRNVTLLFKSSRVISTMMNTETTVEKDLNRDDITLYKNVDFLLTDVITTYDNCKLNISLKTLGLYDKWSYSINDNKATMVITDDVNVNVDIILTEVFKLIITFYDIRFEKIKEKCLMLDPSTNAETKLGAVNVFNISVVDGAYYVNNVKLDKIFLKKNVKYIFDQSHTSNKRYPLSLYTSVSDTNIYADGIIYQLKGHNKTKRVYTNFIGNNDIANVQFTPDLNTPKLLYYRSLLHNCNGGTAFIE